MRLTARIFAVALFAGSSLYAGQYNEVLNIGDAAPTWQELPGTDGKMHALSDFQDKDAVVVVFTCLSCPTAVDYEARFEELAKKYGGPTSNVGFAAICVNRVAADRLDKLTDRANEKKLSFPYLYDESQKIAKDYGAIFTPEFYVLNKQRKVVYMGAMDDATDADKVTKRYVEDALAAALKGSEAPVTETIARGCRVRYVRDRK
ncbi:thioredoxin family protein [Schlesneria paludicola]|uniref:thioredoxin family protein n=1 Tax=Schlesneria paludicola TaxID=360056 RepID=UPI00029A7A15|nr:thioredoxin family protein [Schlesneria paludicola]